MTEDTTIKDFILGKLEEADFLDSYELCTVLVSQWPEIIHSHQDLHSHLLSLEALNLITLENQSRTEMELTEEGNLYADEGTPEFKFGRFVSEHVSAPVKEVLASMSARIHEFYSRPIPAKAAQLVNAAMGKARQLGYVLGKDKLEQGDLSKDKVKELLLEVRAGRIPEDKKVVADLKKRALIRQVEVNWFIIRKGPSFVRAMHLVRKKVAVLTEDMVKSGEWENVDFTPLNFDALGSRIPCGHEHPLLKVRYEFRRIFLEMGFEEMDTSRWIESSFWNFDSLFQGQQHPCRDMHDTFFTDRPEFAAPIDDTEYFERVKKMHEVGGDGSIGLRYKFEDDIARTNIMRTHTTACSSRYLKMIADEYKQTGEIRPRKFFSIDRVYRNETLDATHLAEFHQVEGFVLDKNLSVGSLMGYVKDFFGRIGINEIEFKPAYNPYTEPSMEIFAKHEGLGKWIEIGNSGMFRPEMLSPMQLPDGWSVIAWGFSLERPTMIEYAIDKIGNLEGPNVMLELVENVPVARLTF